MEKTSTYFKQPKNMNARERGYLRHCWGGPATRRRCYRRGCKDTNEGFEVCRRLQPERVVLNKWWR